MRHVLASLTVRGRSFLTTGLVLSVVSLAMGLDALLRAGVLVTALPLLTAWASRNTETEFVVGRVVTPARLTQHHRGEVVITLHDRARVALGVLALEEQVPRALGSPARFLLHRRSSTRAHVVSYSIHGVVRGKHRLGPLSIRTLDPFGLAQSVSVVSDTSTVTVVPVAVPLRTLGAIGAWSGTGEVRPHALAVGGTEDITVREYQRGDDLRRVHWRSTARTGDLMVRREEQPWQSRASVLVDTRAVAHVGSGQASSLEWAVTAAASAVVHLAGEQITVRLACGAAVDVRAGWHDRSTHTWVQTGPLLDSLAAVGLTGEHTLGDDLASLSGETGLLLAILGGLSSKELAQLRRVPGASRQSLCLLLDVESWQRGDRSASAQAQERARTLRASGWVVSVVGPYDDVRAAWDRLVHPRAAHAARTPGTLGDPAEARSVADHAVAPGGAR